MDPNDKDPFPRASFVGKAPAKQAGRMINPAWRLAGSNHPYAPFTGNPLMWQSYVYDDASTCAGTVRELPCHLGCKQTHGRLGALMPTIRQTGRGAGNDALPIPSFPHACRYEGLMELNIPHNIGVMSFGSFGGGGIGNTKFGDRCVVCAVKGVAPEDAEG